MPAETMEQTETEKRERERAQQGDFPAESQDCQDASRTNHRTSSQQPAARMHARRTPQENHQ